jgi:hypothetical protein
MQKCGQSLIQVMLIGKMGFKIKKEKYGGNYNSSRLFSWLKTHYRQALRLDKTAPGSGGRVHRFCFACTLSDCYDRVAIVSLVEKAQTKSYGGRKC